MNRSQLVIVYGFEDHHPIDLVSLSTILLDTIFYLSEPTKDLFECIQEIHTNFRRKLAPNN